MTFGVIASIGQTLPVPVLERIRRSGRASRRLRDGRGCSACRPHRVRQIADQDRDRRYRGGAALARADCFGAIDAMFSDPQTIFSRMMSSMRKITLVVLIATALMAVVDFFWTHYLVHRTEDVAAGNQENKQSTTLREGPAR